MLKPVALAEAILQEGHQDLVAAVLHDLVLGQRLLLVLLLLLDLLLQRGAMTEGCLQVGKAARLLLHLHCWLLQAQRHSVLALREPERCGRSGADRILDSSDAHALD